MGGVNARPFVEYRVVGDGRTSGMCSQLAGKVWRSEDAAWRPYSPPNHINCRASMVTRSEDDVARMGLSTYDGDVGVELRPGFGVPE